MARERAKRGFWRKWLPARFRTDETVVPVVVLDGPIGASQPFRGAVNLGGVAELLDEAFETKRAPAVAIVINSPGGSPVQSRLVYERIRALAEEHDKKVHVVVEDVAASGGYMIACAGDDIIADPSSIVGSIGVVSAGFGFVELIAKLGIERRVHTIGEQKAILDPFRPERAEDVEHLATLQHEVYETFVDLVRERRGQRLKHDADLFEGLFWTGKRALELGLVDELGDLRSAMRSRYGDEVELKLIEKARGLPWRRPKPGIRGGAGLGALLSGETGGLVDAEATIAAIEKRLMWARFGL